jgi:hypothetical protein
MPLVTTRLEASNTTSSREYIFLLPYLQFRLHHNLTTTN